MGFDPEKHHRRSIRLKGHNYAGGGLYFITLCAHREFIAAAGATCLSPVREIIAEEWMRCGELRDDVFPGEFVVMPDHFHGLIEIRPGRSELGHVIGAFKAAVSRRIRRRRGDSQVALSPDAQGGMRLARTEMRIWHRNYYEMIVRTPGAADNIRNYIRMNPWKCIQTLGNGLRGMGNPALWNAEKIGILCSRAGVPRMDGISEAEVYLGGFHSPSEKQILEELLKRRAKIIICPAWDLGSVRAACMSPLQENRLLILEMKNREGNLAAAEQRNRFVIQNADRLWIPHVTKGGMLDRLLKETRPGGM